MATPLEVPAPNPHRARLSRHKTVLHSWGAILEQAASFDVEKMDPWVALRNTVELLFRLPSAFRWDLRREGW